MRIARCGCGGEGHSSGFVALVGCDDGGGEGLLMLWLRSDVHIVGCLAPFRRGIEDDLGENDEG